MLRGREKGKAGQWEGMWLIHSFLGPWCPPSCPPTQAHKGSAERGLTLWAPGSWCQRRAAGTWVPAVGEGPGEVVLASASSLRSWSAQRPPCSSEAWKVLPFGHSLPRSPGPAEEESNPKPQFLWLIKWIFLWVFWWNNLFLASKNSARGSDLLRDRLCVTTDQWRRARPGGGAGGPAGVGPRGQTGPELLPLHSGSGRAWASAPHCHPTSSQCISPQT